MTADETVKLTELKTKITDVSEYVNSLSYSTNLFNHVKTALELLAALVADIDTKLAVKVEEPKAEEKPVEKKSKTKPN